MASGSYDGLHSSAPYGHGDSWRPSAGSSWVDRDAYYTRRPASPGRRYPSYDAYYPQEDTYRPSSYRPDDDDPYYSRSPSPDHYSRYGRPIDTWDRTEPWGSVPAPWDEPMVASSPPTSSASKAWRDPMIATRMFEPSDSWKQSHVDRFPRNDSARFANERHVGDSLQPRTPNSYYPNVYHGNPLGDSYRPMSYRDAHSRSDHYRPGPGWIERNRRLSNSSPQRKSETSNRHNDHSRKDSGSVSLISTVSPHQSSLQQGQSQEQRSDSRSPPSSNGSPSRSISRGRRSQSRNRFNSDRSLSRGRPLVHKLPIAATANKSSLSSPMKEIFSLKYSWDRPTTAISGKASTPTTVTSSKALPSAHPPQKSSWTRSDSRSSIASTQGSDGVSSNPLLPSDAQESFSAQATRGKEIPRSQQSVVQFTDVEMEPSLLATSPGTVEFGVKGVTETSVKTICDSSPNLSLHRTEATTSSSLAMSRMAELTSSFLMSNTQSTVNGITNPDLLITEFQSADVKSESREECTGGNSTDIQIVPPNALPAALTGESSDANQKDPAVDRPQPIPADARRIGVSVTSLPTPLPTPQPTPDFERAPSPYLPENIPTEALSIRDALRIVVMTRLLCDRQAREDRVDPVLKTNQALAALSHRDVPSSTSEKVIQEVLNGPGHEKRLGRFAIVRGTLVERFEERQNVLTEKVQHLRQEYLLLHERWLAHCANLDEQSKAAVSEPEIVQPTGRTTRRSTANLGDAVRSDLEMEQIIASLGNDEATDPNHLSLRNLATIPDMISVTHGKVDYTYDDTNHSVQDPAEYYGPHTGIDDWNEEEKKIFLDKFAAHPKQFGMIAEHLPNKTAAQCVDYYYLHKKKVIDFRKVVSQYAPNKRKRGRTGKKKGNALLADIRQHDAEVHGDFGSPRSSGRPSRGRKPIVLSESREVKKAPNFRRRSHLDLTPSVGSATPTPEPETRRRGGRRSAAAPLSRTVSVGLEDGEGETTEEASERPVKRPKRGGRRVNKSAATTTYESGDTETKIVELPELAGRRKSGSNANQWSDEDKNIFLTLLAQHGDDFKRIAASMPNKTSSQVGNYYKANCDELDLEKIVARAPQRSPTPDAFEDLPEVHTPTIAETPAREAPDEPLSLLAQKLPQTNGVPAPRYTEHPADQETSSKVPATWKPLSSRPLSPPLPTSHVRGYYSINHRPTSYYPPPPHPIPTPTYAPPVPYTYPPYTAAPYPQYDPYHRLSPYSLTDPGRRMPMPMRTRENPYPVLSQPGQPPYHYPLES